MQDIACQGFTTSISDGAAASIPGRELDYLAY
jgi:hypothetical protein